MPSLDVDSNFVIEARYLCNWWVIFQVNVLSMVIGENHIPRENPFLIVSLLKTTSSLLRLSPCGVHQYKPE